MRKRLLTLVAVVSVAAVGASPVRADVRYNVTDLGTYGGSYSAAYGINDLGQVVGEFYTTRYGAFLWSNGTMSDIGQLGNGWAQARAINNVGQIVGQSYQPVIGVHAFVWQNQVMTDLTTWDGNQQHDNSYANSINDAGQIVGYGSDSATGGNTSHACRWESGGVTELSGFQTGFSTYAYAVNAAGEIGGASTIGGFNGPLSATWRNDVFSGLGSVGQDLQSHAYAIDEAGRTAGSSMRMWMSDAPGNYFDHATLWANGQTLDLGEQLGASWASDAYGMNDHDQIVGSCQNMLGTNPVHAILWDGGLAQDLNALINQDSGWVLTVARDINNNGWIVGEGVFGGTTRAFLLTPVPEPGSALLLVLGMAGLLSRRRR